MYQTISAREVFCTVRNDRQAAEIVRLLKGARFSKEEISVFLPRRDRNEPSREMLPELRDATRALPRHLVTALIRMGMPEYEANRFAARLAAGEILVSVHTESDSDVDRVCESLEEAAAEGIVIVPRFKFAATCVSDALSSRPELQIYTEAAAG